MDAALSDQTDETLVDLFVQSALRLFKAQDETDYEDDDDLIPINREILRGWAIRNELKRRGPAARLKLTALYDHTNIQVRLNAAAATLGFAPVEAREVMEVVANSRRLPQSGEAGMLLRGLDKGSYKPD